MVLPYIHESTLARGPSCTYYIGLVGRNFSLCYNEKTKQRKTLRNGEKNEQYFRKMKDTKIRIATKQDAQELLALYAPYVEETAITFEYQVPSLSEFENRIVQVLERFPYLVAIRQGQIVGYAYAGPFKARAAYAWAVETTVYIRRDQKKTGLGRELSPFRNPVSSIYQFRL